MYFDNPPQQYPASASCSMPGPSLLDPQATVPHCHPNVSTQQLGRNIALDPPTVSEVSFPERYVRTTGVVGGRSRRRGNRKSRRQQHRRHRHNNSSAVVATTTPKRQSRRNHTLRQQQLRGGRRRRRNSSSSSHRGGGYTFKLDACPVGGLPEHVSYPDV
jgi:hypothetical protein